VTPPAEGAKPQPQVSRIGQIDYLMAYFANKDNHYIVRAHVPAALGRLLNGLPVEDHEAYKQKVAELCLSGFDKKSKEQVEVQQSCVLALGQIGDNDADKLDESIRAALMSAAEDVSDQQARNFSLIALAQVGGRTGQGEAAKKDDVPKHLVNTLEKGKSALQPWAAVGIGVYGRALIDPGLPAPADVAGALRAQLVSAKAPEQVAPYAIGAGIMKDLDARDDLLKKLDIKDDTARGYVAVALGLMGAREAIDPIKFIITESKHRPELLKQAAIGLGLLGDKELVPDLIKMLEEAKNLSTQAALASALGSIGDSRSIEPLVAMLGNKEITDGARGFAAVALGIVADKEALPWNSKVSVGLNYRASTPTLNDQEGTGILNIL
jgi:HEAT repeat protein